MDLSKMLENELNDLKTKEKSIELAEKIKQENISRIKTIKEAMENLTEHERNILKRTCIDKVPPKSLEKEFGCTFKKIYLDKNKSLNKLVRLMYGTDNI